MAREFNVKLIVSDLEDVAEKEIQQFIVDLRNQVAEDTPVRTGWAKSNWRVTVGKAPERPIGTKMNIDPKAAIESAATAARWKLKDGPLLLSNLVPYIGRLNDGSSTQAPRNFVEKAIAKSVRKAATR